MVDIAGGEAQELSPVGTHVYEENVCRNATESSDIAPKQFETVHAEKPSIDHIMPTCDGIFHCPISACKSKLVFDNRSRLR